MGCLTHTLEGVIQLPLASARVIVAGLMKTDEENRFFGEMMSGITTRYELGDEHSLVGRLCGNLAIEGEAAGWVQKIVRTAIYMGRSCITLYTTERVPFTRIK
jgi:hypothetical protein